MLESSVKSRILAAVAVDDDAKRAMLVDVAREATEGEDNLAEMQELARTAGIAVVSTSLQIRPKHGPSPTSPSFGSSIAHKGFYLRRLQALAPGVRILGIDMSILRGHAAKHYEVGGMRKTMGLVAVFLVLGSSVLVTGAGKERSIVAVFDIQTKFLKLSKAKQDMLTELLGQELGVDGIYQVMPPGDVKRALLEQSAESYKECYDEKCQVQLGRQLPANKLVTTTIMKTAGKCRVMASLYDLRKQTTDIVAKAKCACTEEGLVPAIEKVAAKLRAFRTGTHLGFVEEDLGEKQGGEWDAAGGQEVIVSFASDPPGAVLLVDGQDPVLQKPEEGKPRGGHEGGKASGKKGALARGQRHRACLEADTQLRLAVGALNAFRHGCDH